MSASPIKAAGIAALLLAGAALSVAGCSSEVRDKPAEKKNPYPPIGTTLDDFCRHPKEGVFALPERTGGYDVVSVEKGSIGFFDLADGKIRPATYGDPVFRKTIPDAAFLSALPKGASEKSLEASLGKPAYIGQTLVLQDQIMMMSGNFADDYRYARYLFVSTTPSGATVRTTVSVTFKKDAEGTFLSQDIDWWQNGTVPNNTP